MKKLPKLLSHLKKTPSGPIQDKEALESLLYDCWDELAGSDANKMTRDKLDRMENAVWSPPVLSFEVERHGGMNYGSKYAEVQVWEVDIVAKTATPYAGKKRLLKAREPRLDVRPLADEIAKLIIDHKQDERLSWKDDWTVHVKIGAIIPDTNQSGLELAKETVNGRRNKFRKSLEPQLDKVDWTKVRANVYAPPKGKKK